MSQLKLNTVRKNLFFFIILAFIIQSCDKGPTAGFRVEPAENPEAGDSIFFINESIDATSFEWEFGNGETSDKEMPVIVYNESGEYNVALNAINEKGNDTITSTIVINDPTVMAFLVTENDSVTPLQSGGIWIYTDETEWDNLDEPDYYELTDSEGYAEFVNMENTTYYIWILKETDEGLFISGGYTEPLSLNEINLFVIYTEFLPNEDENTVKSGSTVMKSIKKSVFENAGLRRLNR